MVTDDANYNYVVELIETLNEAMQAGDRDAVVEIHGQIAEIEDEMVEG